MRFTLLFLLIALFPLAEAASAEEGWLAVRGTAGATLSVDGRSYGPIPVEGLRLPAGNHRVRLAKRGYEPHDETVRIRGIRGENRVFYLHKKRTRDALWRNMLLPGWGEYYYEKPTRGAYTLLIEAVLVGYAAWQNREFLDRRDVYDAADLDYRRAVGDDAIGEARKIRDEAYENMDDIEGKRDQAILAAAVVYGLSLFDTLIGFPFDDDPAGERIVLSPVRDGDGTGARIALRFTY